MAAVCCSKIVKLVLLSYNMMPALEAPQLLEAVMMTSQDYTDWQYRHLVLKLEADDIRWVLYLAEFQAAYRAVRHRRHPA